MHDERETPQFEPHPTRCSPRCTLPSLGVEIDSILQVLGCTLEIVSMGVEYKGAEVG